MRTAARAVRYDHQGQRTTVNPAALRNPLLIGRKLLQSWLARRGIPDKYLHRATGRIGDFHLLETDASKGRGGREEQVLEEKPKRKSRYGHQGCPGWNVAGHRGVLRAQSRP